MGNMKVTGWPNECHTCHFSPIPYFVQLLWSFSLQNPDFDPIYPVTFLIVVVS